MLLSQSLGYLSLIAFLAMWGHALQRTCAMSRNDWNFGNHDFDKLQEVLDYTLRRCLRDGFVIVEDRQTKYFIQFRKYILAKGDYGLELGFPDAPWARAYYPKLREALSARGIPFREDSTGEENVPVFLHVDCGQDLAKAVEISRLCFLEIFGIATDTRFKSTVSDYDALEELVDDPEFIGHGRKFWSVYRTREQAAGRPDPTLTICAAFVTVALQVAFVALWICWFLESGAPPDWAFTLGPLYLAGGDATWIALLCFGLVYMLFYHLAQKVSKILRRRTKDRTAKALTLLYVVALPLAVATSWLGL